MTSKISFGTQLPPDLVARLRATVVTLQHDDPQMTIARFTEHALTTALDGVDNGVTPPVRDTGGLRPGRRIQEQDTITREGAQ